MSIVPSLNLRTLGFIAVTVWALSSIILLPFPSQIIAAIESDKEIYKDAIIWHDQRSSGVSESTANEDEESTTTTQVIWIRWFLTLTLVVLGVTSGLLAVFKKPISKHLLFGASGIFAAGSVGRVIYEASGRNVDLHAAFLYLLKTIQDCEETFCQIYYSLLYLVIPAAHVSIIFLLAFLGPPILRKKSNVETGPGVD